MLNNINTHPAKQKLIIYFVLAIVTFAVFGQVYSYDFINVDDNVYVTENSHVKSGITPANVAWAFGTTDAEFWHPLTWLSLMFDYYLYGLNAGGYHMTNLILHILSTLLLFWLFSRMTGEIGLSAFVAALFALHPLRVQSVAFIAERKDVLSVFWGMLTLCLYVYYTEKPVVKRYLPVLFFFIPALMSKSIVVTLPFIMVLLDYWPLGRFESKKEKILSWQLREKAPFLILSAVFSLITLFVHHTSSSEYIQSSLGLRIINAPVSFISYLGKILWPYNLAPFGIFPDQPPFWLVWSSVLLIITLSAVVIAERKRLPYLFVGWFWYVITLLPVIGIIRIAKSGNRAMADNYTYLPSIGLAVGLAWGIGFLFKHEDRRKKILFPAAIAVLAVLSVMTWRQCHYWENSIVLANRALQITEDNYLAYTIRGNANYIFGKYLQAISDFNEAVRLKPDYLPVYMYRGVTCERLGQYQSAIEDYNEVIRLKPDYFDAYNNRGNAYALLGRYHQAIEEYGKTLRLKPDYAEAYNSRGNVYTILGRHELALKDYDKVIRLKPDYVNAYNSRGNIYAMLGQYQPAIEDYGKAIHLNPDIPESYNNRGIAYFVTGDKESGCRDVRRACDLGQCRTLEEARDRGFCR